MRKNWQATSVGNPAGAVPQILDVRQSGSAQGRVVSLDSAYNGGPCAEVLEEHGLVGEIAAKGVKAPIQVGRRWVVERTHSWMNGYGELRRCFQRTTETVEFYLYLAAAFVTVRCLIQQARNRYRWDTRPEVRRLK